MRVDDVVHVRVELRLELLDLTLRHLIGVHRRRLARILRRWRNSEVFRLIHRYRLLDWLLLLLLLLLLLDRNGLLGSSRESVGGVQVEVVALADDGDGCRGGGGRIAFDGEAVDAVFGRRRRGGRDQ